MTSIHTPPQRFAKCLDNYDRNPAFQPPWGGESPAFFLLDGDASELPQTPLRRDIRTVKLVPSQAIGLSNYAAAIWLYDTIVRVTEPGFNRDVLARAKVAELLGDLPVRASSPSLTPFFKHFIGPFRAQQFELSRNPGSGKRKRAILI